MNKKLNNIISTERIISASSQSIFTAFEQGEYLAQWWGPNDFTNTFEQFEFRPDGKWVFVMQGPNGANYPNEAVFREIETDKKIVIGHISSPHFTLTILLTPHNNKTHIAWIQEFESPELAEQLRPICEPSNEQNLDRLESFIRKIS